MPRARDAVAGAVSELQALARAIDALGPEAASAAPEEWLPGIAGLAAEWERLAADLDALASPGDADVCWAQSERGAASLFSLPLAVSRAFAEKVLDRFRSTVLTSATLAVAGSFDHLVGRLGLDRRDRRRLHFMQLESPFEHERQCVLLCDPGFPHPSAPGYGAAIARALESLIVRLPRRTMVHLERAPPVHAELRR
jgi:ATP-dependent DNA helicase DinG